LTCVLTVKPDVVCAHELGVDAFATPAFWNGSEIGPPTTTTAHERRNTLATMRAKRSAPDIRTVFPQPWIHRYNTFAAPKRLIGFRQAT
ncbi:MAG: hypothetical protein EB145_18200, partial [Proteobacteria bacterium]|nr:hypothetical protein [Pseudomonadota bacterium]